MTGKPLPEALRSAEPIPLERDLILACLDASSELDKRFARACADTLAALSPAERGGALAGITGHVAESVVELILERHGWSPVWHFTGPGRHGVDLLLLDPAAERLFAVEVKATLRAHRWPRLRASERGQMDAAWLDKADNPGMADWTLGSADVYGAVVLVSFHEPAFKAALTTDLESWLPITDPRRLDDLDWAMR